MIEADRIDLALDAVGAKHSGAATVLLGIIEATLRHPRVSHAFVFCSPPELRSFELPAHPRLTAVNVAWAEFGPLARVLWHRWGLPAYTGRCGARVLFLLSGAGRAPRGVPCLCFIQQALPFSVEAQQRLSLAGRVRVAFIRRAMSAATARCSTTIVQTPTMKASVERAFRIPQDRITVVQTSPLLAPRPQSPSSAVEPMRRYEAGPRLLYVGNTSPYKNLSVLPIAMRELGQSLPRARLFATVPHDHFLARAPLVCALGQLNPGALREAYELATALVMPSLTETVGLPMLEAASVGVPVIAADRPYARDVCGDTAIFFDPLDPHSLAEAIRGLLTDPSLARQLGAAGKARATRCELVGSYARMVDLMVLAARRRAC